MLIGYWAMLTLFDHDDSCFSGRLSGKVAIVTASTEGIGYGIAQKLASEGANVMISSRKV